MSYLFFLAFVSIVLLIRTVVVLQKKNKELQERLSNSEQDLESLQRSAFAQQKLISLISHHIRGPFSFVLRMASILSDRWDALSDDERTNSVHLMRNSLDEMDRTLRDVIDWAKRKQAGELETEALHETADIVIDEANYLSGAAKWKGIKLIERIDFDVTIYTDRDALHLIMQNLISNAIKYSREDQVVEVFCEKNGIDAVSIGVSDQAGGMAQETADRIFSPFNHPNTTGSMEEQGTGIGLLLAQDLAEQLGTEIQLETDSNGSRFYLIFPISTPQE